MDVVFIMRWPKTTPIIIVYMVVKFNNYLVINAKNVHINMSKG